MIVELIGPKAAGKTTVAPLVANRLGIAYYRGQAFHNLEGKPLTTVQEWFDRGWSVVRAPVFFYHTMRVRPSTGASSNFVLNTCRRNRFAARATRAGSGVMESGPLHALCQAAAGYRSDMTQLVPYIFQADFYVRLVADPAELRRRFEARGGAKPERIAEHEAWVERYEEAADEMLTRLDRPIWKVDAMNPPEMLADEIAGHLTPVVG